MNYYQPREMQGNDGKPTGKWHYTIRNDDIIRPVGYCAQACPGHSTPAEARLHYRQYLLDNTFRVEEGGDAHFPCAECGTLTNKRAGINHMMPSYPLCEEHATLEQVAKRYDGPGDMVSSW